jgi:hypothetical protein
MPTEPSLIEVRQAQAELITRVVRSWPPAVDVASRARVVDALAQEGIDSPKRLRALANDVLDHIPKDGTVFDYMNRQRKALAACFASTFDALRATRDQARALVQAGLAVPSLETLEQAIREAEQVEADTLAHWVEFPEGPIDIRPQDCISNEDAFARLSAGRDPERLRELQNRLERLDR